MQNLVLAIFTVLILAFIWAMWLRQGLSHLLQQARASLNVLQKDLAKRRDMVPLLLEGYRSVQEPNDTWRKLLNDRALFHDKVSLEKEWEFEKNLLHFLQETKIDSKNFLQAKKDIEEITTLIEKEKTSLQGATEAFNERRKQFPYSLASAIFGFKSVSL